MLISEQINDTNNKKTSRFNGVETSNAARVTGIQVPVIVWIANKKIINFF